jgi:hypothetical protein
VIHGSKKNPKGSAASEKSASKIELSEKTIDSLKKKLEEFKEKHPNNTTVTLNDLKAVYRRGSGAYSKCHRPTITGGVPNSRAAWSFARVNKFLEKAAGHKVKKAYVQDDDLLKYEDGGLIAPNGKPSNLTPEQYKLVRTPEFKAWFGDWENDPENASKVIDDNGEPLVCYHRTDKKFTIFDKEKLGQTSGWATAYFGFYFSNKNERGSYGKKIIKCFLSIKNPYFIETETYSDFDYEYKKFAPSNFKNNDGVFIQVQRLVFDEKADKHFVAFEPEQIKLADGSNTTFDVGNPDIRYEQGGHLRVIGNKFKKKLKIKNLSNPIFRYEEYGITSDDGTVTWYDSNSFTIWIYDDNKAEEKLKSGEYDYFIAPTYVGDDVGAIWNEKEYLNKFKGTKHLVGYIEGKKNTSYENRDKILGVTIGVMTVRPDKRRLGINSLMIKYIRDKFDLQQEQIDFYLPTNEGQSFIRSKKYSQGGLIAPNGNNSNLNTEQYALVRTPEFKAWFGDWENDPKNASKVVDENGEPLVVYHGTGSNFSVFHQNKLIWTTPDVSYINKMKGAIGQKILSLFGNSRKILDLTEIGYKGIDKENLNKVLQTKGIFIEELIATPISFKRPYAFFANGIDGYSISRKIFDYGYDAIYMYVTQEDKAFAFLFNDQIKLADGSNTTFDTGNPDIRYEYGGKTFNDKELLAKWKRGESIGFTGEAHLKAKGLIPRADGSKRKSEKYAEGGTIDEHIKCVNCGWEWETSESDEHDKYVCHKCGFDNTLYYGDIMSKLKKPMSLADIAAKHNMDEFDVELALQKGIVHEMEHTDYEPLAEVIALHHLTERPDYYVKLEEMMPEPAEEPLIALPDSYANESSLRKILNGQGYELMAKPSEDVIEQVIAEEVIEPNPQVNETEQFKEPLSDKYTLWVIGYAERGAGWSFSDLEQAVQYAKNMGVLSNELKNKNRYDIRDSITGQLLMNKSGIKDILSGKKTVQDFVKKFEDGGEVMEFEIENYIAREREEADAILMSHQTKIAKVMICKTKIEVAKKRENEATSGIEKNAWQEMINIWEECFDDVKNNFCIKYDDDYFEEQYKEGGQPSCGCGGFKTVLAKGGLAYGNSHDKGGIPAVVRSTGQKIEFEGGEAVVNKKSMAMGKEVEFEGKRMTPCEVVSKINQMGGGVKFKCEDVEPIIASDGSF